MAISPATLAAAVVATAAAAILAKQWLSRRNISAQQHRDTVVAALLSDLVYGVGNIDAAISSAILRHRATEIATYRHLRTIGIQSSRVRGEDLPAIALAYRNLPVGLRLALLNNRGYLLSQAWFYHLDSLIPVTSPASAQIEAAVPLWNATPAGLRRILTASAHPGRRTWRAVAARAQRCPSAVPAKGFSQRS